MTGAAGCDAWSLAKRERTKRTGNKEQATKTANEERTLGASGTIGEGRPASQNRLRERGRSLFLLLVLYFLFLLSRFR
jgi:hypothetical protein